MIENPASLPAFTPAHFERFRQLLQEQCGMYFDENKFSVIRNMVQERMVALNVNDYIIYYDKLKEAPQPNSGMDDPSQAPTGHRVLSKEMRRLIEGLAVNETSFFRNREHYRAITEEVLPRIFRRNMQTNRHLRIWSAGCSTGQEPYSLAIAVLEALQNANEISSNWKIEILATDISEKALRLAHAGRYRSESMRGLSPEQISRYFRPLSASNVATAPLDPASIYQPGRQLISEHRPRVAFEVSPQIRELIKFHFFNLVTPVFPPDVFRNFDLILCENVTIYFPTEVTKRVISSIYNTMEEGAFLFIGYSETLWQISDRFKLINTHDTFYYQKPYANEDASRYVRRKPSTGPLSNLPDKQITDQFRTGKPPNTPAPIERSSNTPAPIERPITNPLDQARRLVPDLDRTLPKPKQNPIWLPINQETFDAAKTPPRDREKERSKWRELLTEGKKRVAEHDFDKALLTLELALKAGPNEVDVLCSLANLKLKLGDYKSATSLCQKAVSINRLSEAAHLMLAMIHHKEGHIEEAIQEYKHTIYINLEAVIAYMRLADIYRDTGHPRDALREYKRAFNVLKQKNPDEMIEDLSVALLTQACQQNITRLTPRNNR